jgi:hypothetical protein
MSTWFEKSIGLDRSAQSESEFEFGSPGICEYGRRFATWTEDLCDKAARAGDEWAINVAILHLTNRYFDWYRTVPVPHREATSNRTHICVFHVFRGAYERLWNMHLDAAPPPIEIPSPPPPARPPIPPQLPDELGGVWLGEMGDDVDVDDV